MQGRARRDRPRAGADHHASAPGVGAPAEDQPHHDQAAAAGRGRLPSAHARGSPGERDTGAGAERLRRLPERRGHRRHGRVAGPAAQAPTASDPAPPAGESAPEPAPSNDGREAEPPARSDASSPPDAAELENVVRTWSEALNAGDNETAADLFAEGAVVIQGGSALQLATREAAIIFNRSLPCSGAIVDFSFVDNAIVATFELGDRPQGGCDAEPGTLAAAVFVIEDGLIQLWQQIPVPGTDPFPPSDADRTVT
ncbi:MAG: hypothetical protein ACE5EV_01840 [Gaiellales bacterium]